MDTWAPIEEWAPVLRSPGFWGWWYLWVIDSADEDESWRVRCEVFGEDFTDYDMDALFGLYDRIDVGAEEFAPVGSKLDLPFPAGYTWRIHFDADYPGAYHYLLHADLPAPLHVSSMEPMDKVEVLRWDEVRQIVVDLADWWRRPEIPVPGELVPLLFLPLAGVTPAETGEARQVLHDSWTAAGLLDPSQVDTLADWYSRYVTADAEWVHDTDNGFYRPRSEGERAAPGDVSRALTRFSADIAP